MEDFDLNNFCNEKFVPQDKDGQRQVDIKS